MKLAEHLKIIRCIQPLLWGQQGNKGSVPCDGRQRHIENNILLWYSIFSHKGVKKPENIHLEGESENLDFFSHSNYSNCVSKYMTINWTVDN